MMICEVCTAEYEIEYDDVEFELRFCPFCGTDHKRFKELDFDSWDPLNVDLEDSDW
jgi:hypothetical protein